MAADLAADLFLVGEEAGQIERSFTSSSSISWMIRRTIFWGSSALSSRAVRLELMMSARREKYS